MNILAVDTSAQDLLVAVRTDTYYSESSTQSPEFKHSERLMNIILDMLDQAGLKTTDIDLFVCSRGPGSFTGLRIGMATLKGMAYGTSKPLVSVSTLEMWAATVQDFDGTVVPVIDAKKQRWYLSAFECNDGKVTRLMEDIDGNVCDIKDKIKTENVLLVGPDKDAFLPLASDLAPCVVNQTEDTISPAHALIDLALSQYSEKGADDIGQGPVYLRKSDAEIALEERLKAEAADGR